MSKTRRASTLITTFRYVFSAAANSFEGNPHALGLEKKSKNNFSPLQSPSDPPPRRPVYAICSLNNVHTGDFEGLLVKIRISTVTGTEALCLISVIRKEHGMIPQTLIY
jgi:hypothetical protein